MPVNIQIRNVPVALHRKLKSRAVSAGLSLSEYLLRQMRKSVETPTPEQLSKKLVALPRIITPKSPTKMVRQERDRRYGAGPTI